MADQVYNLTQTGAEVQAIINDANNAKGAGATTSLSTDYIMLKDTSGQYHKIQKESFTEAVRNTLASLLVNNDKGTTISQIAAIASGDFGSVTPANLASVLGGRTVQVNSSSNLNDCTQIGVKYVWVGQPPVNIPSDTTITHGMSFVMPTDTTNCLIQYAVSRNAKAVCIRFREGDAWGAWQRIDNYGTSSLSELASALGAVLGIYPAYTIDANSSMVIPHGYGMMVVTFVRGGQTALYIAHGTSSFDFIGGIEIPNTVITKTEYTTTIQNNNDAPVRVRWVGF